MSKRLIITGLLAFVGSLAHAQLASEKPLAKAYGRQVAQTLAANPQAPAAAYRKLPSEAPIPKPRKANTAPQGHNGAATLPSKGRQTVPPYRKPARSRG